jgi:hypothetical protein
MHALRAALGLGFCLAGSTSLSAGTIPIPADVSVSLTAEPTSNLHAGQRIAFTLSVTNHGPEPAAPVALLSSPILDELDLSTATVDCGNALGVIVVDLNDGFHYLYSWEPTNGLTPLEVDETRNCYINLDYTEWAPDVFTLTFELSSFIVDLDSSNNSATVTLRRASAGSPPVPAPSISIGGMLLLAAALAGPALSRIRRPRRVVP